MPKRPIDRELFSRLSPLNGLKPENQVEIAKKFGVEELPAGRFLFKKGDADKRTVYVVTGEVELRNDDKVVKVIKGGTPEAVERFMADHEAAGRRVYGNPYRGYAGAYWPV